jgi:P4 family phage/plasmid primase-like protien
MLEPAYQSPDKIKADLEIARELAKHGVPIFLAEPKHSSGGNDPGFRMPRGWQYTKPDPAVLDNWRPGMAVCAVMGHTFDGLDIDTDKGGEVPEELMPKSYGTATTPSGGQHHLVAPLGIGSKDNILNGVDFKGGAGDKSRGMLFIAPTPKPNGVYEWVRPPVFEDMSEDTSGDPLALMIKSARSLDGRSISYDGPEYKDLSDDMRSRADRHLVRFKEDWSALFTYATTWEEGQTDSKGRGWELLTRDFAWELATLVAAPWSGVSNTDATAIYHEVVPQVILTDPKCKGKWYEGIVDKRAAGNIPLPPWMEFGVISDEVANEHGLPIDMADDHLLLRWLVTSAFAGTLVYTSEVGFILWEDNEWREVSHQRVANLVGVHFAIIKAKALNLALDKTVMRQVNALQSIRRWKDFAKALEGELEVPYSTFNADPELLACANGVVNLRTGEISEPKKEMRITHNTRTNYVPGASQNSDLLQQLISVIDPDARKWWQLRLGQALTGYQPDDSAMLFVQGSGRNGKTTWATAIRGAMGSYAKVVSEEVILANNKGGATPETAELNGLRLALLEEVNDEGILSDTKLKRIMGSEVIKARKLYHQTMSFDATHSFIVMANDLPVVTSTNDGTWRRLLPIRFNLLNDTSKSKVKDDPKVKQRVVRGEANEPLLDWMVQGAMRYFANGRNPSEGQPESVDKIKDSWRFTVDPLSEFVQNFFVLDHKAAVLGSELRIAAKNFYEERGYRPLSDRLLTVRLLGAGYLDESVVKRVAVTRQYEISTKYGTSVPDRASLWIGIRWRTNEDDERDTLRQEFEEIVEELI